MFEIGREGGENNSDNVIQTLINMRTTKIDNAYFLIYVYIYIYMGVWVYT